MDLTVSISKEWVQCRFLQENIILSYLLGRNNIQGRMHEKQSSVLKIQTFKHIFPVRPSGSTNLKLIVSAFTTFDFDIMLFNCIYVHCKHNCMNYFFNYRQDVEVIFHKITQYTIYEYLREMLFRILWQESLFILIFIWGYGYWI